MTEHGAVAQASVHGQLISGPWRKSLCCLEATSAAHTIDAGQTKIKTNPMVGTTAAAARTTSATAPHALTQNSPSGPKTRVRTRAKVTDLSFIVLPPPKTRLCCHVALGERSARVRPPVLDLVVPPGPPRPRHMCQ